MTCLNPKKVWLAKTTVYDRQLKKYKEIRKILFSRPDKLKEFYDEWTVKSDVIPCGKCAGCKVDKANDWATRAYLESLNHQQNCFITLTYSDENYNDKNLNKSDLQKFWKRLRKELPVKIKYLACGEYGSQTLRKHYHAAIFGWTPTDLIRYKKTELHQWLYTSKFLERIWGKGYVIVGQLTYESAAYIARYVQKKGYGTDNALAQAGFTPEFITASKKPALALNFWTSKDFWNNIIQNKGILISTKNGPKLKPIPQYLLQKWKETDEESYYRYKDNRKKEIQQNKTEELSKTDKNFYNYLQQKNELKNKSLKTLDKYRKNI